MLNIIMLNIIKTLGILLYALSVKEIIQNQPFDIIIKDVVKEIQKEEIY